MRKHTLIITEKPDAAQRIASALDSQGKAKKMEENGVPYYVAERDKDIIVVPSLGHLYTIADASAGRGYYPVFNFRWVPKYVAERDAEKTRKWLEAISKLSRDADTFVDACDYDIEGSIIGYCILKYACKNKEDTSRRMKYSTLTKDELEKSYAEMLPHLDFALIEAGKARHEVDWLYGVNLSRALTLAARDWSGKYTTISTGRVQGPTLRFLVIREKSIRCFVPVPYWSIEAEVEIAGSIFKAEYEEKAIENKREANGIVEDCVGKSGKVERVSVKDYHEMPPAPFDLGSLQSEAYRLFGYSPMRTSNIAQRLYLDALISYPRTSSQKLPPAIGYKAILKNLHQVPEYGKIAAELLAKRELKLNEGKKEDTAHPAIYPTGKLPDRTLSGFERNLWDLTVRRFMAVFGEPAVKQGMRVDINIADHRFLLRGRRTLKQGWLHFYGPYARSDEVLLPALKEGESVSVRRVILEDKFTKPPARHSPSTLLKKMEAAEIGTKATRAGIIQTLYDRKYVRDETMVVTDLGFEVVGVLSKHCPTITSIQLSRELEEKMNMIQMGNEKRDTLLLRAVETLRLVVDELKDKEKAIGQQLSTAIRGAEFEEREIGACPACMNGKLIILYSRRTGKRFIGCTNYFKGLCKTSFPLPQKGAIKPLRKSCRGCGWPTIKIMRKGRRFWTLCFNPKCPLKKKRREKDELQSMQ